MAGEIKSLQVVDLGHAQHALEQRGGRGIENLEIARIENDPGRIAVAPFDADRADVAEHSWKNLVGPRVCRECHQGVTSGRRRGLRNTSRLPPQPLSTK